MTVASNLELEFEAILAEGRDMTLASLAEDGAPHATTVSYASEGRTIWFGCSAASRKAQNLGRDPRVAITINLPYAAWSQIRGVSLQGMARRVEAGPALERVARRFADKFHDLPQDLPGLDLAVFEVTASEAGVLDYRQGFGHVAYVQLGAPAEAVITTAPGLAPPGFVGGPPVELHNV